MATQCRGTKTKRINRHKLAVIEAYTIIGTLVLIGFIGGFVVDELPLRRNKLP